MPFSQSGCLFIHIPKCAGTSIEVALGVADEYPNIGFEPTSTKPHPFRLFGGGLQHLTLREIRRDYADLINCAGVFSFSIVRDPVDRFISYFVWKRHRFRDVQIDNIELDAFLADVELLSTLSKRMDVFRWPFDGVEYRNGEQSTFPIDDIRRHLLPQCAYLFDQGASPIDAVYPIEAMNVLEEHLQRRGAIFYPVPRRMVGKASKLLRQKIPASAAHVLREVYYYDMRLHACVSQISARDERGFCPGSALTPGRLGIGSDIFGLRDRIYYSVSLVAAKFASKFRNTIVR